MHKFTIVVLLITFSLSGELLYGQSVITGKVVDRETGRSLPAANIMVQDSSYGTASNSQGSFSLKTDSLPLDLVVSFVGYQEQKVKVTEKKHRELVISLKPTVVRSEQITVTDNFEINLVEKAIDKVLSRKEQVFGHAFYRQLTQSDSIYTEFVETFYHAELSSNVIDHLKVENGRYAVIPYDSLKATMYNTNFSIFSRMELVDQYPFISTFIWPLRVDSRDYYNFYVEKRYHQEAEDAIALRFEPKKNIEGPASTGTVVITDSSHTILKLNVRVNDEDYDPVNPVAQKAETRNSILNIEFSRTTLSNDILYPNMIKVDLSYDYIKKKGLFGRTDFKRRIHSRSLLFFYDYEVDGLSQYLTENYFEGEKTDASDYRLIDKADYNPEFWKNNPIILRTPVENNVVKSFEKYGSFGKMFNSESTSRK
ncbi:carboxypeptidase-like regulatory domain-containing protein [Fodinibius saliphilus]|uniref:carboxypeptidase-like regulatory domain-containing protein n=1 Tax=Fodinibius saliphilus TaxID=1920650 RepID=UPI0011085720|nr:carboxypeptidase-like regulatory domain-containing protein [Fodinibius saliphilus]